MSRLAAVVDRVPVRWKLTIASTLLSCVALAGIALAILASFRAELAKSIDRDLRDRSRALATIVAAHGPRAVAGGSAEELLHPQGAVAQVLGGPRQVFGASREAPPQAMVRELRPGHRTEPVALLGPRARVVVTQLGRGPQVLVVARSLGDQERADGSLGRALAVGGPLMFLLILGGSYAVATLALAPVERMQRRATSISAGPAGGRLPVPAADDEIGHLGRTLNALLDQLEEAARHERALIANASHELRTPLARLQAQLELTLSKAASPDELVAALQDTQREVRGLSALAHDLLTLAALDERGRRSASEPVDLTELIESQAALRRDSGTATGRPILVLGEPVVVRADSPALSQAIGNLLDNALVHGRGAVSIEVLQDKDRTLIHVRDGGDGLDLPLADALGRFTRGSHGRARPGAGLGLALVDAVARAHGGEVRDDLGAPGTITLVLGH